LNSKGEEKCGNQYNLDIRMECLPSICYWHDQLPKVL